MWRLYRPLRWLWTSLLFAAALGMVVNLLFAPLRREISEFIQSYQCGLVTAGLLLLCLTLRAKLSYQKQLLQPMDIQKVDVKVEYRQDDYRESTFTVCNKGIDKAKAIIITLELDDPYAIYIRGQDFLTEDGTIKVPELYADEPFPIQVRFNTRPDRAEASWSWENPDGSRVEKHRYFNL